MRSTSQYFVALRFSLVTYAWYAPCGNCSRSLSCLYLHCKIAVDILRNTSSCLRFPLLMYVYVHSRRGSRALIVLLVSSAQKRGNEWCAWCALLRNTALCSAFPWSRTLGTLPMKIVCVPCVFLYRFFFFVFFSPLDNFSWMCYNNQVS